MAIKNKVGNKTPLKYQFILSTELGDYECDYAPRELEEITIDIVRDMDKSGVFSELKVDTLTFLGDTEKSALIDLYNQKGVLSQGSLLIYYLKSDKSYQQLGETYKLDFGEYDEVLVTKSRNGVRIKAEQTGILKKLKDNQKKKVDITSRTALDGTTIATYSNLKTRINFPENKLFLAVDFEDPDYPTAGTFAFNSKSAVQATINTSDLQEARTANQDIKTSIDATDALIFESSEDRGLSIMGTIEFRGNVTKFSVGDVYPIMEVKLAIINNDGTTVDQDILVDTFDTENPTDTDLYSLDIDTTITLPAGKSLVLYINRDSNTNILNITNYRSRQQNLEIKEEVISYPTKIIYGYPIYEAIESTLQLLFGVRFPLYTEFFGRTDVVYNKIGDKYLTEDDERFASLLNGLLLRGTSIDDVNNKVVVKFDDLFQSLKAIYNIGLGYEIIDNEERVRIEDKDYFYIDSVGFDMSGRVDQIQIQKETIKDLTYSELITGYKKYDYEETNGRGEYNTENSRTSIIPNDKTFQNISPYRGDTRGITLAISNPVVADSENQGTGSKDQKYDNDIFLVKTVTGTPEWKVEYQERIQVLNNSSLFGDGSMNLFWTPTRNLLRHKKEISRGVNIRPDSYLTFQASDKLATLETTNGVDNIVENQDISVADLGTPRTKPMLYVLQDIDFYIDDFNEVMDNKYKLIKIADGFEGWIYSIKYKMTENKADIKILAKCL